MQKWGFKSPTYQPNNTHNITFMGENELKFAHLNSFLLPKK